MFCIRKLVWVGILPLFILCGCYKTPSIVGIKHASVTGFSDSLVSASISVEIKNDNFYNLCIRDFSYRFGVLNDTIGQGRVDEQIVLNKNAVTAVQFYPAINLRKVSQLPDSIFSKDSIPVTFYLSGRFTFLRISKTREFTVYVKWKKILDSLIIKPDLKELLQIRKVELKSLTPEKSEISVDFDFKNFLPVSITLDSLAVNVLSDLRSRKVVGSWKSVKTEVIHAGQTETIPVVVSIRNVSMMISAFQKVLTGDFAYYLDGRAYLSIEGRKCSVHLLQKADMIGRK